MIPIKSRDDIEGMRAACRVAANVLAELEHFVAPGVSTYELDQEGRRLIESYGARSACYNYQVGRKVFPAYTCLSVNEEIVHGIGSLQRVLQEGDIITLDVCVVYEGWIGDNARTVRVGKVTDDVERLLHVTEQALFKGIDKARSRNRVGDISAVIQNYVESRGFGIVREFVGHGVGRSMHEEPQVPNFGRKGSGPRLAPGMTICIEPMVTSGRPAVRFGNDGWVAFAADRKPAAHFEHTVLITESGPEILTTPTQAAAEQSRNSSLTNVEK